MDARIRRVEYRLSAMIGAGNISLVSEGAVQKMQVDHGQRDGAEAVQIHDNISFFGQYGFASRPVTGSQALVLYGNGDRSNGVAIGTLDPSSRPADLAEGDTCLHDNRGRRVWLSDVGIVIDANGSNVSILNAGICRIEAMQLLVSGDIVDNCDENSVTLRELRQDYNAHKHGLVQAGTSTSGTTDRPTG